MVGPRRTPPHGVPSSLSTAPHHVYCHHVCYIYSPPPYQLSPVCCPLQRTLCTRNWPTPPGRAAAGAAAQPPQFLGENNRNVAFQTRCWVAGCPGPGPAAPPGSSWTTPGWGRSSPGEKGANSRVIVVTLESCTMALFIKGCFVVLVNLAMS